MKKALFLVAISVYFTACSKPEPDPVPIPPNTDVKLSLLLSSTPELIQDNNSTVTIYFDATTTNLNGWTGEIYAHTGVITDKSSNTSDWKYAPTWLDNSEKYKLTYVSRNVWKLTYPSGIRAYYGVASSDKILQLAFVFRNSDGSIEGKDNGKDIFMKVVEPGLNIDFLAPKDNNIWVNNTAYAIGIGATGAETIKLYQNSITSTPLKTVNGQTLLTYQFTTSKEEDLVFIAEAISGATIKRDTLYGCVVKSTEAKTRPVGIKDGVTIEGDKATFVLYAPGKNSVLLLGDFNKYSPRNEYVMFRDGDYFWITLSGLSSNKEYSYQFLVDKYIKVADPYCEKILDPWNDSYISSTVYPNLMKYPSSLTSEVVSVFNTTKTTYSWGDGSFTKPNQKSLTIYELHFRDFTTEGTVKAALAKLDYLKTLGINAIELMPIQEFDGNDSWGYNPNFFFAADKAYGTQNDYKDFINEAHKKGIAVILDVVFNQTWGQHPWCRMWMDADGSPSAINPFYNDVAPHPYSVGNDLRHSNAKLREHIKEVLKYWITEYHIDGYRFDLSKGFTQTYSGTDVSKWGEYDATRVAYIKEYIDAMKSEDPNSYPILEHFAGDTEENELAAYGALLWRNANYYFGETVMGYSATSNLSFLFGGANRMGYMESHDEERIAYKAKTYSASFVKSSLNIQLNRIAAAAAFLFLSPEARMMWQFGELGYDISIDYNSRVGKKPVLWNYYDITERRNLYNNFSKIITFRTTHPNIFNTSSPTFTSWVTTSDWASRKMVLSTPSGSVVVMANFSDISYNASCSMPQTGTWKNLISNEDVEVTSSTYSKTLAPSEFIILIKL